MEGGQDVGLTALFLSRLQFAFTVSFHIIPSFTIGLAAWLCVLEGLHLVTRRPVYRRLFDFWLKIFGIAFGLGVVSGIVMAFEFGTNWSRLSAATGPIQGPLLSYETFTAFALEASFFGMLIFGRSRFSPFAYFFATLMVALGTTFSAFWIMVNNSWMQAPVGYEIVDGAYVPTDWCSRSSTVNAFGSGAVGLLGAPLAPCGWCAGNFAERARSAAWWEGCTVVPMQRVGRHDQFAGMSDRRRK
jgi:cytochrome bd-type quinol oxidase subunit 1